MTGIPQSQPANDTGWASTSEGSGPEREAWTLSHRDGGASSTAAYPSRRTAARRLPVK